MAEAGKIAALAIVTAVLYLIVKQEKPEYTVLVQLAGLTALGLVSVDAAGKIVDTAVEVMNASTQIVGEIRLLIRIVGVAVVAQLAADLCRDSGATALSGGVELAAKMSMLLMLLPAIRETAALVRGLVT